MAWVYDIQPYLSFLVTMFMMMCVFTGLLTMNVVTKYEGADYSHIDLMRFFSAIWVIPIAVIRYQPGKTNAQRDKIFNVVKDYPKYPITYVGIWLTTLGYFIYTALWIWWISHIHGKYMPPGIILFWHAAILFNAVGVCVHNIKSLISILQEDMGCQKLTT